MFLEEANRWVCKIRWGDCWGHLAYGKGWEAAEAIMAAVEQASVNGCPAEWLPSGFLSLEHA